MDRFIVGLCLLALSLSACGDSTPAADDSLAAPGESAITAATSESPTQPLTATTSSFDSTTTHSSPEVVGTSEPQSASSAATTSTVAPISTTGPGTTALIDEPTIPAGVVEVPFDAEPFEVEVMADVAVAGPGLVAVGTSSHNSPTFWVSEDGMEWSRLMLGGSPVAEFAWSVTAGGPGVVAVGADEFEWAAVWTSVNGADWTKVPHQDSLEDAEMHAVTSFGGVLVAVGWGRDADGDRFAVVWNSPDGVNWERAPHDEDAFGDGATMWDVTEAGPGLIAVGGDSQASLVWTSLDGVAWDQVPREIHEEPFLDDTFMYTVAGTGDLIVAGGYDMAGEGANLWTSQDGLTWSLLERRNWIEFEGATIRDIVQDEAGWVAVGDGIWKSVDGLSWTQEADESSIWPVSLNGATAFGGEIIIVGDDWMGGGAIVWRLLR